jgi:hypothetical protein
MESPVTADSPGDQIIVKIGAAKGMYAGMPASRGYVVDAHVSVKPASVKIGARELPSFAAAGTGRAAMDKVRADFAAATEGWFYDAADRRGVLHVKVAPQRLATGFTLTIGL